MLAQMTAEPTGAGGGLDQWRRAGRGLVRDHAREFRILLDELAESVAAGRWSEAAARAQVAANQAVFWHGGIFASSELENQIRKIGRTAVPTTPGPGRAVEGAGFTVLHVASRVSRIGGHTRNLRRWIEQDRGKRHDLALVRHAGPIPEDLARSIGGAGGGIHAVNRTPGGLIGWARKLAGLMARADLVALHVDNTDIVPFLALAGMERRPPTLLIDHADHMFWCGASMVDCVVNTRRSGQRLSQSRRGVEAARSWLLPLCLGQMDRTRTRSEAKRALGLPEGAILLLTVARSTKYRSLGLWNLAEAVLPLAEGNPDLHYMAIGAGGAPGWDVAASRTDDRVRALPEQPDTRLYLEAADIYVDSFPFGSITSMFEAGLHETPLVAHAPLAEGCDLFVSDSPGFDESVIRASGAAGLREQLSSLIGDPALRARVGRQTKAEIEATNVGQGWLAALAALYDHLLSQPQPVADLARIPEVPQMGDLDLFLPFVDGNPEGGALPRVRRRMVTVPVLKAGPPGWRLRTLAALSASGDLQGAELRRAWRYLVPEWVGGRLRAMSLPGG